ncbi:MAG: hypothetical protein LQ346_003663 [Caloplaca aetnensis]|nr:MAG: hypothetical protein LQ346_003663 [Caloplaca aetnensis]
MKLSTLAVSFLTSLSSAHFTLDSPPARGFDDDALGTFPCGGQNSVANKRTPFPLSGGSIQLTMGHDRSAVQVLIALGNEATGAFNTVLVPTTQEEGIGQFCLSDVQIPESLGVQDGDNATIQVVTNGDPTGGLYNCADITFSSTNTTASDCTNGKGVQQTQYTGRFSNANGTDSAASTTSSASGTGTPSATGSTSTTSPSSAAGKRELGGAGVLAVCMLEAWALW